MSDEHIQAPRHSNNDALIGRVIAERFHITGVIARGSMGKVYRAEQMPLGRTVAIKVLDVRDDKVSGEGFGDRFVREASVLARLNHSNTVRIYDYGLWEGRSFLVMEYIEGTPLSNILAAGAMAPARALSIGSQISASLREAHDLGIVHRDLKPSNVLICRRSDTPDFVKVIDFGLGKELEQPDAELTMAGQILGSPMYMAPEQVRSDDVDQRSDIYALGVVLYRALTGERPYPQRGTPALMYAHLNEPARPFSAVNEELALPPCVEWTVMRCLEKDPSDRFANAGELRRALKACWIALEDPAYHDLQLTLRDGQTILPPELSDINADSMIFTARRSGAEESIATAPPPRDNRRTIYAVLISALLLMGVVIVAGAVWVVGQIQADDTLTAAPEAMLPVPPVEDPAPAPARAPVAEPALAPTPVPEPAPEPAPAAVVAPAPAVERKPAPAPVAATPAPAPAPAPEPAPAAAPADAGSGASGSGTDGMEPSTDLKDPFGG